MGSLILRLKGSAAHSLRRISAGIFTSPIFCGSNGARMMSTTMSSGVSDEWPRISSSPRLMLPPAFEGGHMAFKFYNLAEQTIESSKVGRPELELPDDLNDVKFVGSSHGWLALFNRRNNDVFLLNPLSGRHIKLPPLHTLPDPEFNLIDGRGSVSKVIISCSPDENEEECRAMMTYGPADRLACCWPGRSTEWTPIGDPFLGERSDYRYARLYEDFACCSRRAKLFTCITHSSDMEDWDLTDPGAPEMKYRMPISYEGDAEDWDDYRESRSERTDWELLKFKFEHVYHYKSPWWAENLKLLESCEQIPYLVYSQEDSEFDFPLLVMRFVMKDRIWNDSNLPRNDTHVYNTVGFFVYRGPYLDEVLVEESLDGLAIFIGINHSFAVSAAEFPGILEPNSIYFAPDWGTKRMLCGHDIGFFNYEKKAFSSCRVPVGLESMQGVGTPPMWFTPSPA